MKRRIRDKTGDGKSVVFFKGVLPQNGVTVPSMDLDKGRRYFLAQVQRLPLLHISHVLALAVHVQQLSVDGPHLEILAFAGAVLG